MKKTFINQSGVLFRVGVLEEKKNLQVYIQKTQLAYLKHL